MQVKEMIGSCKKKKEKKKALNEKDLKVQKNNVPNNQESPEKSHAGVSD